MEQQKVFSTSMFGFDKKTVLDYIYEQDVLSKEKEQKYDAEINKKEEEISNLKLLVDDLNGQLEISKAQLYTEKEQTAAQKAAYDKLRQEADQLIQVARNKDNELQIQLELNKQLQNRYAVQENKLQEALQQIEELNAAAEHIDLGKITEAASKEADKLMAEAKQQAKELLEKAAEQADLRAEEVTRLKEELASFKSLAARTFAGLEKAISNLYEDSSKQGKDPSSAEADKDPHFFR